MTDRNYRWAVGHLLSDHFRMTLALFTCTRVHAEAGYDGVEINGFRPHPHPDDYNSGREM